MPLDYDKIKNWPFRTATRAYTREESVRYARGFGAGLPGALQADDERFVNPANSQALPMIAVALADGEFWQRDPAAGLQWTRIVHVEEAITMHRPLPPHGTVAVERRIVDIYDRGVDKGAMIHEQQILRDDRGQPLVTIDVTTVLRGDGGFGGSAQGVPKPRPVPSDRVPDAVIELRTPSREEPVFRLSSEFDVAAAVPGMQPGQLMLRGMCCFGVAGRAVLKMVCDNDPGRLRRLSVRYAGPILTDETMRTELWRTGAGAASFRLHAVERNAPVLNHCHVEFVS
jgi:acyl dehydratase